MRIDVKRGLRIGGLLAAAVVAVALVYVHTPAFRHGAERRLQSLLSEHTGREVHVRLASLRPLAASVRLQELRIAGATPGSAPFLEVGEAGVDVRVLALLRRRLHLAELSIDRVRIDLDQVPTSDPSSEKSEDPGPVTAGELIEFARIDHAVIRHGQFRYTDSQSGLQVDADDIRIELERNTGPEHYRCELAVGKSVVVIPDLGTLPLTLGAACDLNQARLAVSDVVLAGPGVALEGSASLTDLVPLRGTSALDVELLSDEFPAPIRSRIGTRGALQAGGSARFDASDYEIDLELRSAEVAWSDWVAHDVDVDISGTDESWDSRFTLTTQGVAFEGTAEATPPPGLVPLSARVDVSGDDVGAFLHSVTDPDFPRFRGSLQGSLAVRTETLRPEAMEGSFQFELDGVGPRGVTDLALTSNVTGTVSAGTVSLDRVDVRGPGMEMAAQGAADLDNRSQARVELRVDDAGATLLAVRQVLQSFGLGAAVPERLGTASGRLDVTAELSGPGLRVLSTDSVAGNLVLHAEGLAVSQRPELVVNGDIGAALEDGRIVFRQAQLFAPDMQVELRGGVSNSGPQGLAFETEIGAVGRSTAAILAELREWGVEVPDWPVERIEPLEGTLRLQGELDGSWSAPTGDVVLAIDGFGLPDRPRRALQATATLQSGSVEAHARLAGGGNELIAEASVASLTGHPLEGILDATVVESGPGWWTELAGLPIETEGAIEATISLDLETLNARIEGNVSNATVAGTPFELREVDLTWSSEKLGVGSAELIAFGGRASVAGQLGASGTPVDTSPGLRIDGTDIDLGKALGVAGLPFEAAGTVDFQARVSGTPELPVVDGSIAFSGCEFEGQALPDLAGQLSYSERDFSVNLSDPNGPSRLVAEGGLRSGIPWSVDVEYPVRIDASTFAGLPADAPRSLIEANLKGALSGSAGDPTSVSGRVELLDATVQLGPDIFTANPAPSVNFAEGRARLEPFGLSGGETRLRADGTLGLEDLALSAGVEGNVALGPFDALLPETRLDGNASLNLKVTGSLSAPQWNGAIRLTDGRLTHPAIAAPIERVAAVLDFEPDRLAVRELSMNIGGGDVVGAGEVLVAGPRAGTVTAELSGQGVRLSPEDGLRLETDVALRLDGRADDVLTLSGQFNVGRAAYQRDINVGEQLTARTREFAGTTGAGSMPDRIRLDIDVVAPGGAYVRNNVASVETSMDLAIGGTAAEPRLTGRVELLEGGRLIFRGVTYNVTRGTIEYIDAAPDDPVLDLEAETSIASYDIKLTATGRLADPKIELVSTPSLPQADIVSLLVTGKTRDEMSSDGGLSGTQAAIYLTRNFTRDMEASLRKSLGIDVFRIDPMLVEGETEPTARLTVGKTLTGDVTATFSTALAGNKGDIYQLSYQPRERLSLVGRQDEDSEHSGDVLYTRKFYVGPPRPADADRDPQAGTARVSGVSITGNRAIKTRRLRRDLKIGEGDRFRRPVLLAGLDAIRDRYLEHGYPEARLEVDPVIGGETTTLDITIDEGRPVQVRLDGIGKKRGLRKRLFRLWQQSLFPDAVADDAAVLVLDHARNRGFARATVDAEVFETDSEVVLDIDVDRGKGVRVKRIDVEGAAQVDEERIRAQMLTRPAGWFVRGPLSADLLTQDRNAILQLYRGLGYLDAAVDEPKVDYPEAEDRAVVGIVIDEGQRYRIGEIAFPGATSLSGATLGEIVSLKPGESCVDERIRAARSALRKAYDERGYPEVRVELRTRVDREVATVDVDLVVEEGPHKIIESVDVAGATLTRQKVVEREIDVEAGQPWSADAVAATRQSLYRTGLFKSVGVSEEGGDGPTERRLRFDLQEGSNVRTNYGLGASSDEGARVRFSISHTNLWGRRLYGSTGGRISADEWRAFALVRKPRLFGTRHEGVLSTFFEKEEEDAFDIRRTGFALQVDGKTRKERLGWFVGYGLEESEVSQDGIVIDPGSMVPPDLFDAIDLRDESIIRLGKLTTGLVASSLDDPAWPTRGRVWRTEFSVYDHALASEADFLRASLQFRSHHRLGAKTVWHVGARLGLIEPYGPADLVPISERFFAGGDDTIRGFPNDSIVAVGFPSADLAAFDVTVTEALGGDAQFLVNQELVRPLFDPLSLAFFYDAGNIYWRLDDIDLGDLRHSAGLGVRMRTPIGPLRVEYGWKLDREPDESRGRFHFSLGMAF